jgi:hypothetical protein
VFPTLIAPITFSYGGNSYTGTIPDDVDLCGATIGLQRSRPTQARGLSFSPGLSSRSAAEACRRRSVRPPVHPATS